MSTAVEMQPAEELVRDEEKEAGWDPYQVWKEQVEGVPRVPLTALHSAPREEPWSPYEVWAQHVARKR